MTPAAIPGCPTIGDDCVRHLFKQRFDGMKGTYKVENNAAAAARHGKKTHNTKVISRKAHVCRILRTDDCDG